jgi:hypothetical protein
MSKIAYFLRQEHVVKLFVAFICQVFFKRFIAHKIHRNTQGYKIVPLTNLPYLSFAEASDRVFNVLGMYRCSREKQVRREKHCGSWVNGYRRCLGRLCMYFLYWRWRSARV